MIQPTYYAYVNVEAKAVGYERIEAKINGNKNNYYGKSDLEFLLKNNPDITTIITKIVDDLEADAIYVSPIKYSGLRESSGKRSITDSREIIMNDQKTIIIMNGLDDIPKYEDQAPAKTRIIIASESEATKDKYYNEILDKISNYKK